MWNGKNKALTFSFDDGVLQDGRAIEILDKYNLKATFNINSGLLGTKATVTSPMGITYKRDKFTPDQVREVYKNHEVAVHTISHPNLTELEANTITYQVEQDRLELEKLTGKPVIGMAYPCGGVNNDDRVAQVIKDTTNVRYSRTITSTYSFNLQDNLYRFNPSVYFIQVDKLFELGEKFISLPSDTPAIFYVWGHTYELDGGYISWEQFEDFCKLVSGKEDIFYGTNTEILLNK